MGTPTADAKFLDYLTGVDSKLVPLVDGTYANAVMAFQPLAPSNYDYIALGYTGSNLTTVRYYLGGAGGTLVVSLTLAYDGSGNLMSVTRS
jgi:hypothetical protein